MGMRWGLAALAVGALAGWSCSPGVPAQTQQPELKSTEAWIVAFVERNALYQTSAPHRSTTANGITLNSTDAGRRCTWKPQERTKLRIKSRRSWQQQAELAPHAEARRAGLNGRTMPGEREWVLLRTASGAETIELRRGGRPMSMISVFPMQGGAPHAQTEKLAETFRRAIAACRAKP